MNSGKHLKDAISQRQVRANPEEGVVQQLVQWLLGLGYKPEQIQTHPQYTVRCQWRGRSSRQVPVDVAVFEGRDHSDEHLLIIAECKRSGEKKGLDQLRAYLRGSKAKIGVWFNGRDLAYVIDIPDVFTPEEQEAPEEKGHPAYSLEFGAYLRAVRQHRQATDPSFSLRQLALRVGISPAYLSQIESGSTTPPSNAVIHALAQELDEDEDVLRSHAGRIPHEVREMILLHPKTIVPLIKALRGAPDHVFDKVINIARQVRDGKW